MPLTRVVQTVNNEPISPIDALKQHPMGRRAYHQTYMCEICMQYVEFIAGGKNTPHFKHAHSSKDCEEKLKNINNYLKSNPLGFSLPLYVEFDDNQLNIYIGFLPLPHLVMTTATEQNEQVHVSTKSKSITSLDICPERFSEEHITYIPVGNEISDKYILTYSNNSNSSVIDSNLWPRHIDGFNEQGTLFDATTGRKISEGCYVEIEHEYHLFSKILYQKAPLDILLEKISVFGSWHVYRLKATKYTQLAKQFFFQVGMFLKEVKSTITQLWPPAIQSTHSIEHNTNRVYFHKTDGIINVYPNRAHRIDQEDSLFLLEGKVHQILSVSRFENHTRVLNYLTVETGIKKNQHKCKGRAKVRDLDGNDIYSGDYNKLPRGSQVKILIEYDGFVDIRYNGFSKSKIALVGGEEKTIGIEFGYELFIFEGLDIVASLYYRRQHNEKHLDDLRTLQTLQGFQSSTIEISHIAGMHGAKFAHMPKTHAWLLKQIRQGEIDSQALEYIKHL